MRTFQGDGVVMVEDACLLSTSLLLRHDHVLFALGGNSTYPEIRQRPCCRPTGRPSGRDSLSRRRLARGICVQVCVEILKLEYKPVLGTMASVLECRALQDLRRAVNRVYRCARGNGVRPGRDGEAVGRAWRSGGCAE